MEPTDHRDWLLDRVTAYRLAADLADAIQRDVEILDRRFDRAVEQLIAAAEGISASIAEGYVRRSSADRARYYEYANGSAEEARARFRIVAARLSPGDRHARYNTFTSIARLLTTMIRNERDGPTDGFP